MADRRVTFLIGANIQNFTKGLNSAQRSFERFGRKMERMGSTLTRNVTAPLVALGGASVKSAIDFESAFAGVRKTVDATESEFAGLRKGILDMSKEMPTSANEIAGVAEAAGQLGIQTDSILDFSRTMVMLGDTTNMAANEAATALARIANIMQVPQDQFDEMGSVIVDLGNNFATTEAEIVDFAQRISGAANIAGFATEDVFALGAAFSSVGVEAGLGGTAVQKVMIGINTAVAEGSEKLTDFAEVAGMSAEQFQTLWREDAGEAFATFVNGLGAKGDQAAGTLEKLGLADQRLMRAFLSLANAGDLVNRTLDTGSKAWQENVALTNEAQQRYDTIASKLSVLKNRIIALGISVGDALMPFVEKAIEFIGGLTESFENMSADAKANVLKMAGLFAAGGPLLLAFGKMARAVSALSKLVISKFGLIVGVFALTVTSGQWLVDNWDTMVERMSDQIESWRKATVNNVALTLKALTFFGRALPGAVGSSIAVMDEMVMKVQGLKDNETDFTSFGESGKNAFGLIKESIVSLIDSMTGGSGLTDMLAVLEGGFRSVESSALGAVHAIRRLIQLQSQVDPTARASISGASGGSSNVGGLGSLRKAQNQTKKMSESLSYALGKVPGQAGEAKQSMMEFGDLLAANVAPMVGNAIADMAESFVAGVGQIVAAGGSIGNVFKGILSTLADLAIRVGKIAIGVGIAIEGIKKALQSLNPVVAVAAGIALIALGSIAKTALANAAEGPDIPKMAHGGVVPSGFPNDTYPAMLSSGETVIPSPKPLPSMGQNIKLSGEFTVKGTDLVLTLERAKKKFA